MSHGWLGKRNLPPMVNGVVFDPKMPTRREEYQFAYETAKALPPNSVVLDAGSGVTAHQHVLPLILNRMGHGVFALDSHIDSLRLHFNEGILRGVTDITDLNNFRDGDMDAVFCISVVEHMEPEDRLKFAGEAHRVLKTGGLLCITADEIPPEELILTFGTAELYDFGERVPDPETPLFPAVAFIVGRKL